MTIKRIIYGLAILAAAVMLYHQPRWVAGAIETSAAGQPAAAAPAKGSSGTSGDKAIHKYSRTIERLQPRKPYIVIDRYANRLYLRTADSVLLETSCSVGSGGELVDTTTGRRWGFATPSGVFRVDSKLVDPWWRKPDWAFIEENETIPKNERDRYDAEMMGEYALGFGDGYFIHGTIYERLLGISVTHGCVRVGAEDLRKLYAKVSIGTPVYIY